MLYSRLQPHEGYGRIGGARSSRLSDVGWIGFGRSNRGRISDPDQPL
jgi:hypothetical protein